MSPMPRPITERFAEKVSVAANGCWLWSGACNENGYPLLWDNAKQGNIRAHRFAYTLHVGPIPEGLDLDHLCRVRHCVNPEHLEAVTRSENLRRSPLIAEAARQRHINNPDHLRKIGAIGGRASRANPGARTRKRQEGKGSSSVGQRHS